MVPSDRIANADIDYIGAGDTAVSGKKAGIRVSLKPFHLFRNFYENYYYMRSYYYRATF